MRYSRCEMLKNTGKLRIFNVFHTCALYFKIFFGNNFSTASLIYYDTMASLLFFLETILIILTISIKKSWDLDLVFNNIIDSSSKLNYSPMPNCGAWGEADLIAGVGW